MILLWLDWSTTTTPLNKIYPLLINFGVSFQFSGRKCCNLKVGLSGGRFYRGLSCPPPPPCGDWRDGGILVLLRLRWDWSELLPEPPLATVLVSGSVLSAVQGQPTPGQDLPRTWTLSMQWESSQFPAVLSLASTKEKQASSPAFFGCHTMVESTE